MNEATLELALRLKHLHSLCILSIQTSRILLGFGKRNYSCGLFQQETLILSSEVEKSGRVSTM